MYFSSRLLRCIDVDTTIIRSSHRRQNTTSGIIHTETNIGSIVLRNPFQRNSSPETIVSLSSIRSPSFNSNSLLGKCLHLINTHSDIGQSIVEIIFISNKTILNGNLISRLTRITLVAFYTLLTSSTGRTLRTFGTSRTLDTLGTLITFLRQKLIVLITFSRSHTDNIRQNEITGTLMSDDIQLMVLGSFIVFTTRGSHDLTEVGSLNTH